MLPTRMSGDINNTRETPAEELEVDASVIQVRPGIYDPQKGDPEGKTYHVIPGPSDYTPVDTPAPAEYIPGNNTYTQPKQLDHYGLKQYTTVGDGSPLKNEDLYQEQYNAGDYSLEKLPLPSDNECPSYVADSENDRWTSMVKPGVPPMTHLYKPGRFLTGQDSLKPKPDNLVEVSKPKCAKKKLIIALGVLTGIVLIVGGTVVAALLIQDGSTSPRNSNDNNTTNGTTEVPSATKATPSASKATTKGPPVVDNWSTWSTWSDCDSTCGPGHKHRSRTCLKADCVGTDIQSDPCTIRQCFRAADTYNKWGSWGPWTQCGASCGDSTQSRERVCSQDVNKKDCIGSNTQQRTCNLGVCPDCTLSCTGSWGAECLVCTCMGSTVTGRVITSHGGPIENVKISPLDKPYLQLTTTGVNGGFDISDMCDGQELIFTQNGFQSKTILYGGEGNLVVEMKKIVPLTITKQPVRTARLTSKCVELRCEATGYPSPDYYEWFQDGVLITDESDEVYSKTNLRIEDTGFYRCRANNDYGAVLSDEVFLNIQDSEHEFCQSNPSSHVQNLPSGCLYHGRTFVDVGKCTLGVCSKGDESSCSDNKYECGIIRSDLLDIDCGSYRMALQTVTECGCVEKEDVYLELIGTAVDAFDKSSISGIVITYGEMTVTSSADGDFVVSLTPGTTRITMTLTDPHGRYTQQVSSFNIGQNLVGSIEHTITMNRRPLPIIFSPVTEILLELGLTDNQPGFADIIIPPKSIFDADGEPFVGDVAVTLNTFDPRDSTSNTNPPGDFTAVGSDGQQELLESVGMMNLNIQDTHGNNLKLGGSIEILLPESLLQNVQNIASLKFWTLDSDGRWQYASDINSQPSGRRKKRYIYSTTVRGIEIDSVWCNFDRVKDQICHTKIRAYQTNNFKENEQLTHVDVQIVTLPSGSSAGTTLTRIRSVTDDINDGNGYCVVHPCNSPRSTTTHDYHGYIIADYQGTKLTPAGDDFGADMDYKIVDDKIYAKFDYHTSPSGPFYDWDSYWSSSQQCSEASSSNRHFRFYRSGGDQCISTSYTRVRLLPTSASSVANVYAWYQTSQVKEYRTCFLKAVTSWDWATKIEAVSAFGPNENNVSPEGDLFGVRSKCTENKAACLEVRSPFGITDGKHTYQGETLIQLRLVNEKPLSVHINDNLLDKLTRVNSDDPSNVKLYLFNDIYGPEYGIYCSDAYPTIRQAQQKARSACRRGSNIHSNITKTKISKSGWAVWFGAYDNCPGNYSSDVKCRDRWLKDNEYCNEDNFICQRCPNYWFDNQPSVSIPDHYNEHGSCDVKGKAPTHEGCCASCPDLSGWFDRYCMTDGSDVYTPYEYCMSDCDFCDNGKGLRCFTCPFFHIRPQYPNANGRCENSDHELFWEGCCPRVPICPGGSQPYTSCNDTECNGDEYCTEEGYCCPKCPGYNLIPEYADDARQCSDPEHELYWEGCCPVMPKCPGGYDAYLSCVNNTDCNNANEYCTNERHCCSKCKWYDLVPEYPDDSGQCSDPEHELYWEGCCPVHPKCPGGYNAYWSCVNNTDCLNADEYCAERSYCCHLCPSGQTPEPPDNDDQCSNPSHINEWYGCCSPLERYNCPDGHNSYTLCNNTECDLGQYCTDNGYCCNACPVLNVKPESPDEYGLCSDKNHELLSQGCCPRIPKCPDERLPNSVCNATTDCYSKYLFCTNDGACCEYCYYSTNIIPTDINSHGSCDPEYSEIWPGSCCPICPDGSHPYNECVDIADCNRGYHWHENMYCTDKGLCCPLPRCPDSLPAESRCVGDSDCSVTQFCTTEGICCHRPNCPYDEFFGYTPCLNDDNCNTFHEYCSPKGVCCSSTNRTCPNGPKSRKICGNTLANICDKNEYCTPSGICCPGYCTDSTVSDRACTDDSECISSMEYCMQGYCCQIPPCHDGSKPILKCDTRPTICPTGEYCNIHGYCCSIPPCHNTEAQVQICFGFNECDQYSQYCTPDGICCPLPLCLGGSEATSSCQKFTDCPNPMTEVCTEGGLCCPMPLCPDGIQPSITCEDDMWCSHEEYCRPDNICCQKQICTDGTTTTMSCFDHADCQSDQHCASSGGCCPMPLCPDESTPMNPCSSDNDCPNNGEMCTSDGVCCVMP